MAETRAMKKFASVRPTPTPRGNNEGGQRLESAALLPSDFSELADYPVGEKRETVATVPSVVAASSNLCADGFDKKRSAA